VRRAQLHGALSAGAGLSAAAVDKHASHAARHASQQPNLMLLPSFALPRRRAL